MSDGLLRFFKLSITAEKSFVLYYPKEITMLIKVAHRLLTGDNNVLSERVKWASVLGGQVMTCVKWLLAV